MSVLVRAATAGAGTAALSVRTTFALCASCPRSSEASRAAIAPSATCLNTGAATLPPKYPSRGLSSFTRMTYCGWSAGKSPTKDAVYAPAT